MSKVTKSLLSKELNFFPLQTWPEALPVFSWQQFQLTGFRITTESRIVNLAENSQINLLEALHSCYPNLSLPEMARLHDCLKNLRPQYLPENWPKQFWEARERHWNANVEKTISALTKISRSFQDWASEKGLGLNDLAILRSLSDVDFFQTQPLFQWIACSGCTKNDGVFVLEAALELWKMDRLSMKGTFEIDPLPDPTILRKLLDKLRRPLAFAAEERKQQQLLSIPWPAHVRPRWQRRGDKLSLEIKFEAISSADFKKKLEGLGRACQHLEILEDESWRS
jgi:hypothetical protein